MSEILDEQEINKSHINFGKTFENNVKKYENLGTSFGEKGWILPMDLTPMQTEEICESADEYISSILIELYSDEKYFTEQICHLLKSPLLKENKSIILQAYCAFKMSLFSLCISALTPLFENLLTTIISDRKKINFGKIKEEINKTPQNDIVTIVMVSSLEKFIEKFSEHTDFDKPQEKINRHNVAHGRIDIKDDKETAIRYFSNLYNLVVFYEKK